MMTSEKLKALDIFCETMQKHNIHFSIGGSGLLYFLGLAPDCADWDILTEADLEEIKAAFYDKELYITGANRPFASSYLVKLTILGIEFDIIGNFAIYTNNGIQSFPSNPKSNLCKYPISDPKQWIEVYRLLNRPYKNDAKKVKDLQNWCDKNQI